MAFEINYNGTVITIVAPKEEFEEKNKIRLQELKKEKKYNKKRDLFVDGYMWNYFNGGKPLCK